MANNLQVEENTVGQIRLFNSFISAKNGLACLSFAFGTKNLT